MSRAKWIALALGLIVLVAAALVLGSGGASGGLVDSGELQGLIGDGVRLVDVRTAGEFEMGHIPGALNVPVSELAAAAASWDTAEPVALYCATGSRSAEAASTLRSLGFETVYDLGGGIAVWGGEIESGPAAVAAAEPSTSGLPVMYEFYTDW
jgi:rhodanese-related sulfurtransferase